jgi:hypothetical protein
MRRVSPSLARPSAALPIALALAAVFLLELPVGPHEALAKKKPKPAAADKDAKEAPTPPGEKPFGEVVKDAKKSEGCFTIYRSKDHVYFEVPEQAIGTDYCLSAQVVDAVGDWSARGSGVGQAIVRFQRWGDQIAVVKRNLNFTADSSATIRHAVDTTFPDSPILSKPVATTNPSNHAAITDLDDLFGSSTFEILSRRSGFKATGDPAIVSVHDNPENLSVRVAYRFERPPADGSGNERLARLADPRNMEVTIQYDLFRLPQDDFRPRVNDDRLGFWDIGYKDYTGIDDRDTPFRHRAVRWNVQKTDPHADQSPAKKPIVFYIDKATPREVRPLIREGALWWNEAFAAVGITNAMEIREEPDSADWDPTDIRYSMIYWNLSDDLNFSGMAGPSLTNPITGEVLKANVYLNAEFLSYARHRYLVYSWWRAPALDEQFPWRLEADARARSQEARSEQCDYGASFSSQLAFARLVLQGRGLLVPGTPEEDRFARQAFLELVAHEVGHALGFAHNFKASRKSTYADVVSQAHDVQLSGSVMDYNPINLPPKGQKPGDFVLTRLGDYDKLAVEYLYSPLDGLSPTDEQKALDAIAVRAETKPGLEFDDGTLSDIDPSSNTDDLGDDPIRFADDRLAMVDEVMPKLGQLVLGEGHDFNVLRQALDAAIFSVSMDYFDIASRHVGGQEILRIHHGAANNALAAANGGTGAEVATLARAPIKPIPASVQRAALDLLDRRLFSDDAYAVGPDLLNLLKPDLEYDWNYPYRYGTNYAFESRLAYLYGTTLGTLFDPLRIARVKDNENRYGRGEPVFTLPELFDRLTSSVMKGLEQGNISATGGRSPLVASKRRTLQRIYVGELSDLVLDPPKGMPADASVLAAAQLRKIRTRAKAASTSAATSRSLDAYGRAHLADLDARIGRVMDAKIGIPPAAH